MMADVTVHGAHCTSSKVNFKVPNKITYMYEHSPYYIGTKLWDELPEEIQKLDNVYVFKNEISKIYKAYETLVPIV